MGRPPKPLEVHRRNGNPSRKKLPDRSETITLVPVTDTVPMTLGPQGREVYRRAVDLASWLSELDRVALRTSPAPGTRSATMRDLIADDGLVPSSSPPSPLPVTSSARSQSPIPSSRSSALPSANSTLSGRASASTRRPGATSASPKSTARASSRSSGRSAPLAGPRCTSPRSPPLKSNAATASGSSKPSRPSPRSRRTASQPTPATRSFYGTGRSSSSATCSPARPTAGSVTGSR